MNEELGKAYREFFKTPLGVDMSNRINSLYIDQLKKAAKSSREDSWALINKADGIDLVKSEFKRLQTIDKRGEGRK